MKDLLYGFRGHFSCGTRRVLPSGQDSSILPAWVANHSAGFGLPAHRVGHIISVTRVDKPEQRLDPKPAKEKNLANIEPS